MRLDFQFYNRDVVKVAKEMLGKELVLGSFSGIITETEAYGGDEDDASHAARGMTPRTKIMFGRAGMLYVYMIYGMYYCLNIVTGQEGKASAVLIRGLHSAKINLDGPGKICRHTGVTTEHNGIDLLKSNEFYLKDALKIKKYKAGGRIGIKKATDKPWRFVLEDEIF